jgi:ribosomal protein S18 acetylase RimI-like enzyme
MLREQLRPGDEDAVRQLVESSGFFREDEVEVAVDLVRERRERGPDSGYGFLFAERHGESSGPVGYTCYGKIPCTVHSYDLYWIATQQDLRGRGIGRWLLEETEARILDAGGRRVYIDTSGRELYAPTRRFYVSAGYRLEATFEDYYGADDAKLVYAKRLR